MTVPTLPGAPALPAGVQLALLSSEPLSVLLWRDSGRTPTPHLCEDIGEDCGLYSPVFAPDPQQRYPGAVVITEGFTGQLCTHEFSFPVHGDGRLHFFHSRTCMHCRVNVATVHSRRGRQISCEYGGWAVRAHIFHAWTGRGPVPGSLEIQSWH